MTTASAIYEITDTGGAGIGTAEGRPALHGTAPNRFAAKQPESRTRSACTPS